MNPSRLVIAWGFLVIVAIAATNAAMTRRNQAVQAMLPLTNTNAELTLADPQVNLMYRRMANAYALDFYDRLEHNARWQLPAADITADRCDLELKLDREALLTNDDRQFYRAVEAMCNAKFADDASAYQAAKSTAMPLIKNLPH